MIKKTLYTTFDSSYDVTKLNAYNLYNTLADIFPDQYMNAEKETIIAKTNAVSQAIKGTDLSPKINTLIFGRSTLSNKVVLTVDI